MAENINNSVSFPSSEYEALAYLYLQQQDIKGKSPEEIYDMYADAYHKMRARNKAFRNERRQAAE